MSKSWHGGKGSDPRKVDAKKFNDNWDKIFGKKKDNVWWEHYCQVHGGKISFLKGNACDWCGAEEE